MVISPQFDLALGFVNDLALVYAGGGAGYINKQGKYIWNPTN